MKRWSVLSVAFFTLMVLVVACIKNPSTTTTTTTTTTEPPSPTTAATEKTGRTIVVSNGFDSGRATLRQALLDARGGDTIIFDPGVFPPNAPATIFLAASLPEITQGNLTIDASDAGVILDGENIGMGLSITSNGNIVRGLQIVGFSDVGIGLGRGAQHNIIGGDRAIGDGPLGQGNLVGRNGNFGIGLWDEGTSFNTISGNYIGINLDATETWGHTRDGIHSNGASQNLITGNVIGGNGSGIYLCCVAEGRNTVTDNIVGTDPNGNIPLGNHLAGVLLDRSSNNVIGPGNVIAFNDGPGVMFWDDTPNNTLTRNSIHDNGVGIGLGGFGDRADRSATPIIFDFDLEAGNLVGWACPNCSVEIFSDRGDEGAVFEGQVDSDTNGVFVFNKGAPLTGPHLTAIATDQDDNTSEFSASTTGTRRTLTLQEGNSLPRTALETRPSGDLDDNRIGLSYAGAGLGERLRSDPDNPGALDSVFDQVVDLGAKRIDTSIYELEEPIDWTSPEDHFPWQFDELVDDLAQQGVTVNYLLHFWDKATHESGEELSTPRFRTQEQIDDYLAYVRLVVAHFRSRIAYYTVWSEPDNDAQPIKHILPEDYINLASQVIPVIRGEDPDARIVVGPVVLFYGKDYLFEILRSDVIAQFDAISWHPMYDAGPDIDEYADYYYRYPSLVQEIKQTAEANGFRGEYMGSELTWCGVELGDPTHCWRFDERPDLLAAKYYARVMVMQLGMDVSVGLGGFDERLPWAYQTIRRVSNVMAGAAPADLVFEIESQARIVSYGFILPDGDQLVAVWTNGIPIEDDPGVSATMSFPSGRGSQVVALDVLHGYQQEVTVTSGSGGLLLNELLVKDYPILLRISQ